MSQNSTSDPSNLLSLKSGSTDTQAIAQYYDDWAETYDATLDSWEYEAPNDAVALLSEYLTDGARILDVGCGTGLVAEALSLQGQYHIEGIDISEESLKRAEERGAYERLVRYNLQKPPLPLEGDAYDVAISVGVLTYIENVEPLFRDLCRCVRSGGVIAFTHRTDLWQSQDYPAKIQRLEDAGLWTLLHVSEPHGYLPGHEYFGQ